MSVRLAASSRPGAIASRHDYTHQHQNPVKAVAESSRVSPLHNRLSSVAIRSGSFFVPVAVENGPRPCKCLTGSRCGLESDLNGDCVAQSRRRLWRAQASQSGTALRPEVETVGFNDGSATRFAPLINGCWTLAGGHGRVVESEIIHVMEMYARSGLTSFDTADIYGPSESILGAFREQWMNNKQENDGLRDVQARHRAYFTFSMLYRYNSIARQFRRKYANRDTVNSKLIHVLPSRTIACNGFLFYLIVWSCGELNSILL